MARKKKFYFGWTKIKWAISEISKLYSDEKSYFSKKRVESGIGFIIAQWGMIYFLTKKIDVLSMSDLAVWAGIEFLVAGYTVTQTQSEKKLKKTSEVSEPTDTMIKS